MKTLWRVVVSSFVLLAAYYFIYWLPFSLVPLGGRRWIATSISLLCAVSAAWFAWVKTGSAPSALISSVLYGAIVVGSVGFCAGFIGPILFAPEANQGPLLGILITGPGGALIGAIGGLVFWRKRRERPGPS